MSDSALGHAITSALQCLNEIYNDLTQLVHSLDRQMQDVGWSSVRKNTVSDEIGPTMTKEWLLSRLLRVYCRGDENTEPTEFIGIQVHLNPPGPWKEPVCLAAHVSCREPLETRKSAWANWKWDGADELIIWCTEENNRDVPAKLRVALHPQASTVKALLIPLCEIRSESLLNELLVRKVTQLGESQTT